LTDVYIDASEANKDKEIIRYSKGKSGKLIEDERTQHLGIAIDQ
jgi:hypothetical protein